MKDRIRERKGVEITLLLVMNGMQPHKDLYKLFRLKYLRYEYGVVDEEDANQSHQEAR